MFSLKTWIAIAVLGGAVGLGAVYLVSVNVDVATPEPKPVRIDQQQLDAAADRAGDRAAERMRAVTEQERRAAEERRRARDKVFLEGIPKGKE